MHKPLIVLLLLTSQTLFAQFHFGTFLGGANYIGELNSDLYKRTKPAIGVSLNYEVSDRVMLRSGLTVGKVEGADRYSGTETLKQVRNLHFKSNIVEFSLIGELTAFNLYNIRWSPYVFAGVGLFRFNPYTDTDSGKVYLKPLSTEGQGLPGNPEYSLIDLSIPFGGGIKYNINENVRIGLEVGLRKLFTDYLDDVSKTYIDENELLAYKGQEAVNFSYRGDEYPGGSPAYPAKGAERGNPVTKDWYYFSGLHLTFRIGGGYGKTDASGKRNKLDCPKM
ncbi:MAG TPA: DUF6089 family protein [Flavisolibacter sp.]|nr:DUF6089 family protein [Flavisolibacter sp.]